MKSQILEVFQLVKYLMVKKIMKIKIKQIRSGINRTSRQKKTLQALGLKKMNQIVEHNSTPQILGMINAVSHLVRVENN